MKMKPAAAAPLTCPPSSSNFFINSFSCLIFFVGVYVMHDNRIDLSLDHLAWLVVAALLPQVIRDVLLQRKAGAYARKGPFSITRILIKLSGLYATFALIAGMYWIFPEYGGSFYQRFFNILTDILPWLMALAIPYIAWYDGCQKSPEDGLYHMGAAVTFRWRECDPRMVFEHLKGWLVKAFFLPLMITYAIGNMESFFNFDPSSGFFLHVYDYGYHLIFTIDLLFATFGYIMTFRALNTQIFSAEPTFLGWFVCLIGYTPFWEALFYPRYFNYDDSISWVEMAGSNYTFLTIWGSIILILIALYTISTIAFGYRFSNLTYRGIITGGTYRFTKHPAYIFKNISWWMISVPFIVSTSWWMALGHCMLLLGVNFIYYMRARTEENHLSNYPEYVAYAEWMNDHGIFRFVGNKIPYFKYSKERAGRWNSKVYAPFAAIPVTDLARQKS